MIGTPVSQNYIEYFSIEFENTLHCCNTFIIKRNIFDEETDIADTTNAKKGLILNCRD